MAVVPLSVLPTFGSISAPCALCSVLLSLAVCSFRSELVTLFPILWLVCVLTLTVIRLSSLESAHKHHHHCRRYDCHRRVLLVLCASSTFVMLSTLLHFDFGIFRFCCA